MHLTLYFLMSLMLMLIIFFAFLLPLIKNEVFIFNVVPILAKIDRQTLDSSNSLIIDLLYSAACSIQFYRNTIVPIIHQQL